VYASFWDTLYKIIILPVILYGCETWSLTLRDGNRLRVFEDKLLRRIFGPKRDEVTEDRRKPCNQELHTLYAYSSPNIMRRIKSRKMRWAGYVARMGEMRSVYNIWFENLKGRATRKTWA
jgi:hypothetical protein